MGVLAGRLWLCMLAFGLLVWSVQVGARAPAVPVEDMHLVELAAVAVDSLSGTPVVLLRKPGEGDVVPISIGTSEARAILLGLRQVPVPRPMTHDLIVQMIESLGARLERVMVDAMAGGTYLGLLDLRLEGRDEPLYVDSRPSDALALAVRTGARILVAPDVLAVARGREFEDLAGGQVVTALGVTVGEVGADLREALGLPDQAGVVVSRAVGTAADLGLAPGAMILEVNGEKVQSPMQFLDLVQRTPAGAHARLLAWQDGVERLIELPTDVPGTVEPVKPGSGLRV